MIDATARLLFLASQSEGLLAGALFQKVMIKINPMGVNFQRGLFALAGLSWDSTIIISKIHVIFSCIVTNPAL
jgi:hypothetical protein